MVSPNCIVHRYYSCLHVHKYRRILIFLGEAVFDCLQLNSTLYPITLFSITIEEPSPSKNSRFLPFLRGDKTPCTSALVGGWLFSKSVTILGLFLAICTKQQSAIESATAVESNSNRISNSNNSRIKQQPIKQQSNQQQQQQSTTVKQTAAISNSKKQ